MRCKPCSSVGDAADRSGQSIPKICPRLFDVSKGEGIRRLQSGASLAALLRAARGRGTDDVVQLAFTHAA